jgi:hypothetical protein
MPRVLDPALGESSRTKLERQMDLPAKRRPLKSRPGPRPTLYPGKFKYSAYLPALSWMGGYPTPTRRESLSSWPFETGLKAYLPVKPPIGNLAPPNTCEETYPLARADKIRSQSIDAGIPQE